MSKKVLILGKLPPPYIGPAIATEIILNSSLRDKYELLHLNTTLNKSVRSMGKSGLGKVLKTNKLYGEFKRLLVQHKPDLVLIPISQTTLGFAKDARFIKIARGLQVKTLLQLRGSNIQNWLKQANRTTRSFVETRIKSAQGVIVLGENLRYLFEDYFDEDRIFVVPNGGNYSFPGRTSDDEKINILYLSNFLPGKGIDDVINAISVLHKEKMANFQLTAIGAWDNERFRRDCMDIVKHQELPVTFLDTQSGTDKLQQFSNADIFVFTPTKPEGHPWVIVEAMAASLPIITTDQGAIIESVLDGQNGFIVEANNPAAIAEKLKMLICDPESSGLREQMGRSGRLHYEGNFTEEKMVERLDKVFQTMLNS